MSEKHIDEVSGVETTGHEWDGIRELNNPLPRWWLWTFYPASSGPSATCCLSGIPLINGATKGVLGYSSRAEVVSELAEAKAAQERLLEKVAATPVEEIARIPNCCSSPLPAGLRLQGQLRAVPRFGCCRIARLSQPQ
jgi:cytochrome c oxidase cbb3-type subunit 3